MPCPKDNAINILNDIELISKEIFEYFLAPKHMKQHLIDANQLSELLIKKDDELKNKLKEAQEQELIQSKIESLEFEVEKHDEELRQLQMKFKEAEHILATAIYQAKQKLAFIQKANLHPILNEDLIKYAHKISADHSVAAPYNWEIGDPRRPYPTVTEMKPSWLFNSNDANLSNLLKQEAQLMQQSQQINQDSSLARSSSIAPNSPYPWGTQYGSGDVKMNVNLSNYGHTDLKNGTKDNDDVEVMSTDSSSSSSSDSQ